MAVEGADDRDDAAGLAALIARAAGQRNAAGESLPPVERWDPPFCGDIDMEIAEDGTWFYMGTPISRTALVRLFSTVLRKDGDGRTYLVTPVEKVAIRVADAPFVAVEMEVAEKEGETVLVFRTNVGDVVEAGPAHPLRFPLTEGHEELKPYLLVRGRLEARLSRAVMYELAERVETLVHEGEETVCIRSAGAIFPIMPAGRLDALSR